MVRVVVVEDEPAARARIAELAASFPGIEVIAECGDGAEAVRAIVAHRPDLVFLDVQLPELDGFEVLEALSADRLPHVVFITAHDEYAVRAFDAHAVDYLLKPFGAARFTRALTRALDRMRHPSPAPDADVRAATASLAATKPLSRFVVRSGRKVHFVRVDDVDWIDVADNYLRLHAGGQSHLVRGTLTDLMPRLDPERFVRVNRGTAVNVERIAAIESDGPGVYRLTMADGARLVSGRSYGDAVRALLR